MNTNSYRFFQNKQCKFFPCHNVKPAQLDDFSCLFCYCPLYNNKDCGGHYIFTRNGIKDCSYCTLPHFDYDYIVAKIKSC